MSLDAAVPLIPALFLMAAACFFLAWRADRFVPAQSDAVSAVRVHPVGEVTRQLEQAGFRFAGARHVFTLVKILSLLIFAGLGQVIARMALAGRANEELLALMLSAGLGLMGMFLPVFLVDQRRAAYQTRIRNAVPDALDFLQVCVEAGQSIDAALMRVTEELVPMHPDLARAFRELTDSLAAGADRGEAFEELAEVTDSSDLRQFATILNQSARMGTPVAQTLRVFSADLRDQHLRNTEARANVLPTKMTLGSMIFTVPPLLIVLLAPSLLRLVNVF